ncbi:hypothetical protein KC865_03385 [Candidatus Kaiserbacteria bacterium]|nr:hypothetical protein [Candidatus Kaiserbacteria bacterium]USN92607.1 MAG: hypothetical protein H6782_02215 [Candidatus Nomurabacteria bacterium]
MDRRTIRNLIDTYQSPPKLHMPRNVHLVVDATYFGERNEETCWCLVVFRCPRSKENLWWTFCGTETTSVYKEGREYLESLGYTIQSVTGDGFGGIRQAFSGVPFQMCHVHMERLVIKGTTRKPQTEAGQVLLAMVRSLQCMDQATFRNRMRLFFDKYHTFMNECTTHPLTGDWSYTHEGVRSAYRSLVNFEPYLFVYQHNKKISRTTNSLEGHFSHINRVTSIHRGLSKSQKQKVLHSICLASSVSPTEDKLAHIL